MSADGNTDLQIIYELRWKSADGDGYNTDKVNIMGILDTPDTCADWTTFKSYLMQNSGANEDISVSYVDSDGDEILINDRNYDSALKYCRQKARKKEKVILTLKKLRSSKDHHKLTALRMKFHEKSGGRHQHYCTRRHIPNPFYFVTNTTDSDEDDEQPPLWFLKYMKKFKQEISDMIAESMYCMMINGEYIPKQEQVHVINDKKKMKKFCDEDSSDCIDGFSLGDRLLKKVHKLQAREKKIERKYEAKIGKLEHKVKRIIDKKTGLRSEKPHTSVSKPKKHCSSAQNTALHASQPSALAATHQEVKVEKPKRCGNRLPYCENGRFKAEKNSDWRKNFVLPELIAMNAIPLNRQMVTEFAGRGDIITKRWEVMNNGLNPWTDETELRFTWGSSTLVPLTKVVKVPKLKSGETGVVEVTMQAPDALGRFESYWYFFHTGIRFGHWLGCAYAIGLQKDDRCRPMYYSCQLNANAAAVDLTTSKCPRYCVENNVTACSTSNRCTRYRHINNNIGAGATTDDMKMSKTNSDVLNKVKPDVENSDISNASGLKPVDCVVLKPEKFETEIPQETNKENREKVSKPSTSAGETLSLLMETNESTVECLKPNTYESKSSPLSCDELLNLDNVDKINNQSLTEISALLPEEDGENEMNVEDEEENPVKIEYGDINSDRFSDSDNISVKSGTISVGSTDHGDDHWKISAMLPEEDGENEMNEDDDEENHVKIEYGDLNSDRFSDSDNISVISGTISVGSTDHGDDFVMIPMPELRKVECLHTQTFKGPISKMPQNGSSDKEDKISYKGANEGANQFIESKLASLALQETGTNTDLPGITMVDNTKIEKPITYSETLQGATNDEKIEKPQCHTVTDDADKGDMGNAQAASNECSHNECNKPSHFDANTFTPPFLHSGMAHCNFGDPNCGSGPNGPRFPPSVYAYPNSVWRNGCSPAFGNEFTTCDQIKKTETPLTTEGSHFDTIFPGPLRSAKNINPEGFCYPHPGYIGAHTNDYECNYDSRLNESTNRRFVFNNSGTGFETYPQQQQAAENATDAERPSAPEVEIRKPARYSYVYGEGSAIPTTQTQQSDPSARSPVKFAAKPPTASPSNGVHILPETIVNGAIQVASNAFNTACNVYDMIRGEGEHNNNAERSPTRDTPTSPATTEHNRRIMAGEIAMPSTDPYEIERSLQMLYEMGFQNRDLNRKLLKRYDNDIVAVISKLV